VRSLSAVALLETTFGTEDKEFIKWYFNDALIQAHSVVTNTAYPAESAGLFCLLSSMIFRLSADTYDYQTEEYQLLFTTISAGWVSGARFADLDIDLNAVEEITSIAKYDLFYDTFPNIRPPVLYINYENTDYSPVFYRAQQNNTLYNARLSAVYNPSLLNLTNLLTNSENFRNTNWTTATNMTVVPDSRVAPDNKLSATKLVPISATPFNTIDTITNILSSDLPDTFLANASSYVVPMTKYTTTGSGISAVFTISVASSTVSNIGITNGGRFFEVGDGITIDRSQLGLASTDNTITFDVGTIKNVLHEITKNVGPLIPQNYTYSVFAYPSGGKYLYFGGFNQGYAIFDLEQEVAYNFGEWTSVNIDKFELENLVVSPAIFNAKFDAPVNVAVLSGSTIFFGGEFTKCNDIPVNYICAVDLSGNVQTKNFAPSGFNNFVNTIALSSNGKGTDVMYVGGKFTEYRGNPVSYITCLTGNGGGGPGAGKPASASFFTGSTNGEVYVIKYHPTRNIIFAGGAFSTYNGASPRHGIIPIYPSGAQVPTSVYDIRGATSTGVAYNNNTGAGIGRSVRTVVFEAPTTTTGTILLGGDFNNWRGSSRSQKLVRTSDKGTRLTTLGLNPGLGDTTINTYVNSIVINSGGDRIYVGGNFSTLNGAAAGPGLICLTNTGGKISDYSFAAGSIVKSLVLNNDGSRLYVGGAFTNYGSSPYYNLLRINTSNNLVDASFNTLEGFSNSVNTIVLSGNNANDDQIFIGGTFTRYKDYFPFYSVNLLPTGRVNSIDIPVEGARDWRRCTASFTLTSQQTDKLILGVTTNETTVSGNAAGKDDVFVWGAQLNYGIVGPTVPYLSTANTPRTSITTKSFLHFNNQIQPFREVPLLSSTIFTTICSLSVGNLPMMSALKVTVSADTTFDSFRPWYTPHTLTNDLSVIFVSQFLTADFVAYPQYYFLSSGQQVGPFGPLPFTIGGGENYTVTPGPCFYGEGHTELINLCADGSGPSNTQFFWNIEQDTLKYEVSAGITYGKYGVFIPTQLDYYPSVPINLVVSDGVILSTGPFYFFNDTTGQLLPYPFFLNIEKILK
jgi:hypothetical protein